MSPKMGQKLTDNPKDKRIQIRMDSETLDKLDCLVAEQNSDRSKIIRQGIEIQYEKRERVTVSSLATRTITQSSQHTEAVDIFIISPFGVVVKH